MRSAYKRWKNYSEAGDTSFVTTTVLDFNRAFQRDEMKEAMLRSLVSDCRHYGATLHAYVIMAHHLHVIVRTSVQHDISSFMRCLKKNSATTLRPLLLAEEERGFDEQRGLNERLFCKKSFRSVTMRDEHMFFQKVVYIHTNPVRARLCSSPADYRWSSAWLYQQNLWSDELGLPLDTILS